MDKTSIIKQIKEINYNIDEAGSLINKAFEQLRKLTKELSKEE